MASSGFSFFKNRAPASAGSSPVPPPPSTSQQPDFLSEEDEFLDEFGSFDPMEETELDGLEESFFNEVQVPNQEQENSSMPPPPNRKPSGIFTPFRSNETHVKAPKQDSVQGRLPVLANTDETFVVPPKVHEASQDSNRIHFKTPAAPGGNSVMITPSPRGVSRRFETDSRFGSTQQPTSVTTSPRVSDPPLLSTPSNDPESVACALITSLKHTNDEVKEPNIATEVPFVVNDSIQDTEPSGTTSLELGEFDHIYDRIKLDCQANIDAANNIDELCLNLGLSVAESIVESLSVFATYNSIDAQYDAIAQDLLACDLDLGSIFDDGMMLH